MSDAHIYQIFYDEQTQRELDPGFIPLDNLPNERPDWREYWPIRRFLTGHALVPGDYYGFFSPKFGKKTGLGAAQVHEFVARHGSDADVVLFSPFFDMSALFSSIFEQGDRYHPGLARTTQDFLDRIGLKVSIRDLVTDSRNTVFCNYFVAKPRFWTRWLEIGEPLFQIAEDTSDSGALRNNLLAPARYDRSVTMKTFIMERIATLILATDKRYIAKAHAPLSLMPGAFPGDCLSEMACSDALKIAWADTGHEIYRNAYYRLRQIVEGKRQAARAPGTAI